MLTSLIRQLSTLESQLRNVGHFCQAFVAAVALSDAYRQRFFDTNSHIVSLELELQAFARPGATQPSRNPPGITANLCCWRLEAEIPFLYDSDDTA